MKQLAALIGGVLYPLAFEPFGYSFLIYPSLAILFYLWLDATPKSAFLHGWLFGLGQFGAGVFWIHESFRFSHLALPVAIFFTGLLVLFLALYPGLVGYLATRWRNPSQSNCLLLLFPVLWVAVEWLRGWFLTGFPWLQAGYSQIDTPLSGIAPMLGVLGISWAVAFGVGALLLVGLGFGRISEAWRGGRTHALPLLAAVWAAAWIGGQTEWTEPAGEPKEAALIQGNIPQDIKWLPQQRRPTLELYRRLSQENWDVDLIIWPETAVPAYRHRVAGYLDAVAAEAKAHGVTLLTGIPVKEEEGERYYNSIIALGEGSGVYRKRHLVPFGEYLPLKGLLGWLVDILRIPMSDFSMGEGEQPLLEAAGERLGLSICFEGVFGEEIIRDLPEATLLINLSNDAWFGDSIGPPQHLQMIRMRALESGRYLLRATNTGISALVGPDGGVSKRSPRHEVDVLRVRFSGMQGATPYALFGNLPLLTLLSLLLAGAWVSLRRG